MKTTDQPIVVSQVMDASVTEIWAALTELDKMRQWFLKLSQTSKLK